MKKILGIDLGVASIGWAVIEENENVSKISGLGSRIVPLSPDDRDEFSKGNAISKNAKRTARRTARKTLDRYQLRRATLTEELRRMGALPDEVLIKLPQLELWKLRSRAVTERIELKEFGRVLYHINQKRGYNSSKADVNDKSQSEYLTAVSGRHATILERGQTIGQYFYDCLSDDDSYRVKEQVFPRKAYQEEFDAIIAEQRKYYSILTDECINRLRNEIIFYQRRLKSCKHLVSLCDFEKREYTNREGKKVWAGPRVAPRSSPLFQVCKLWESINNIHLENRHGERRELSLEEKQKAFEYLNNNPKLAVNDLVRILGCRKGDWWMGKAVGKGLSGNTTKIKLIEALNGWDSELLRFDLNYEDIIDSETDEVHLIVANVENEPLYKLWHTCYSINDANELDRVLLANFGIYDEQVRTALCKIDFVKDGFGNKSTKAMRRILPFLEQGKMYSEACEAAGFRHSQSFTKEENANRELQKHITPLLKNELRQPIVEKILNQMVNVVNAIIDKYGPIDEVRVELARELKQSKDEREDTTKRINVAERENKKIADRIKDEYNMTPTRNRIRKYKLWDESHHLCFYCQQPIEISDFLNGIDAEREHIIPRSLYFDDSFANNVCACRKCNSDKGNMTAFDFMKTKLEFESYKKRIEEMAETHKISRTKAKYLLMSARDIPEDFIDRQLRETQYIARKSMELLATVCRNVYATSGGITDFIRHTWGYDEILHSLNKERYARGGMVELVISDYKGQRREEERIIGWTKRLDHRHHAIDALVIALTKQGYVQRINKLNTERDAMFAELTKQNDEHQEKNNLLERWIKEQPHFTVSEVEKKVDEVLISFKSGKKVATKGKRCGRNGEVLQKDIIVPRGALHEEFIYGKINGNKYVIRYPVSNLKKKDVQYIVDKALRELIEKHFPENADDNDKLKELDTKPILFNGKPVKRVRCYTGLSAVEPVRQGYVKPGNNHHIAIYEDRDGNLQENVVTLWHAIERKKYGLPIIIINPELAIDITNSLPEKFMEKLPDPTWVYRTSIQQNEMFILGLSDEVLEEAIRDVDYKLLSKHLYRVQSIATEAYLFRHHLETSTEIKDQPTLNKIGKIVYIKSWKSWIEQNPRKVYITTLGKIKLSYD